MPQKDAPTENIDAYMRQVAQYKRITTSREIELYNIMHGADGGQAAIAREELICSNLRLVVKLAHDFKRCGVGFADLVAEGNLGLMRAADKFDPAFGAKFSGYATWWIKQAMRALVASTSRTIRVPESAAGRLHRLEEARKLWYQQHTTPPTIDWLCKQAGVTRGQYMNMKGLATQTYSMDAAVNDSSPTTFESMIAERPEEHNGPDTETLQALRKHLNKLSDLERVVLSGLYGLDGQPRTQLQLAQQTGLSPVIVSVTERRALMALRKQLA